MACSIAQRTHADGIRAVVDQVAQAKADVVRLVDGRQGGPVRMDVRDDEDPHARASQGLERERP